MIDAEPLSSYFYAASLLSLSPCAAGWQMAAAAFHLHSHLFTIAMHCFAAKCSERDYFMCFY